MNLIQLLDDQQIPHTDDVTAGWVNIPCPFCSDRGNHGGFNLEKMYFNCWKCGWHSLFDTLKELGVEPNLIRVLKEYNREFPTQIKREYAPRKKLILPTGCGVLTNIHREYLRMRRFKPHALVRSFNLTGTGPLGNYSHRIIAPIYLNRKLVSYQGRDITGMSRLKYKACAKENEVVHHKHTLYGVDLATKKKVIVVEGITDVWRLGAGAVATFGTNFTQEQVWMLYERFELIFIMFDPEGAAQELANRLGFDLPSSRQVEVVHIGTDPADLTNEDAQALKRDLIG